MKDNKEKLDQLKEAAEPLIKYLCENHDPHTTAIVTPTGVEIVQGVLCVQGVTEFIID